MKIKIWCISAWLAVLSVSVFAGESKTFGVEGNPIIRDVFTADPATLVVGDMLYLYAGHDEAQLLGGAG